MALVNLPKQFSSDFSRPGVKPAGPVEIDWSNPLSRFLSLVLLGNQQAPVDLVSGKHLSINGSVIYSPSLGWVFGNTVSDYISDSSLEYGVSGKFSSYIVGNAEQDTNLPAYIARGDAGTNEWMLRHKANGALGFFADGGDFNTTSAANLLSYDKQQVVGFSFDTSDFVEIYINGSSVSQDTSGAFSGTSTKPLTIGAADGDANRPYAGSMNLIVMFSRLLSDAEHRSLAKDPYQILRPAVPQFYFTPAATGGLIVQSLSVGALLTPPSLTQHNSLSADNLNVDTTLTEPSLAQNNSLSVDSLSADTSLTESGLTQNNNLSTDNLSVTTQLTSPSLTQHNILVVDDLVSATLLTQPTLVQHNILSVDNLNSATALTEPSLNIAGSLAVANLNVSTQLAEAGLTQHNVLVVESLSVSTSLSNASLAGTVSFAVNDMAIGATITQPTLDAAFVILADNLSVSTSISESSFAQHNVLLVDDMSVDTLLSIVSFGGAVISCLSGYVTIQPVLSGDTTINPALSGDVKID